MLKKLKTPRALPVAKVGKNRIADKSGMCLRYNFNLDGKKIDTMRTLPKIVAATEVGKSVELKKYGEIKKLTSKD